MSENPHPRVGLVIPALDEEQALPLVLGDLPRAELARLVVVDNGSSDDTAGAALSAGAEVVREERRGYGSACLAGIAALRESSGPDGEPALGPEDVIAFVDADYSDHPAELTRVLAPVLADEADLCIGSRVLGGASMQALLPQAWFGNRLACFLMRALFGARYTDLGPMRALTIASLDRMGMRDRDFGWTVEMQLKASSLSLRTLEVPVSYRQRVGESKITGTLLGTLRAGWKILGWIAAWRLKLWLRPMRSSEGAG